MRNHSLRRSALYKLFTIIMMIGSTVSFSACGSSVEEAIKPLGGATELLDKEAATIDTPEAELFESAKRYYQVALYSQAKHTFETLRDGYPLGPYAEFSEIKIADCDFQTGEYASAALLYEEFLKNHPTSPSSPYVFLRAAQSYQLSQRGIGRDSSALHKAVEHYNQLLERYPDSMHADLARRLRDETNEQLAAYDKMVIDFYRRKGSTSAYESRDQAFQKTFGSPSSEFEVHDEDQSETWEGEPFVLANAAHGKQPTALSIVSAARVSAARVDSSVPYDVTTSSVGYSDNIPDPSAQANVHTPTLTDDLPPARAVPATSFTLRGIECKPDQKLVFLLLNKAQQGEALTATQLKNQNGKLELLVPDLTTYSQKPIVRDCFSESDLTLTPAGLLVLKSDAAEASVMTLQDPPRILLALR